MNRPDLETKIGGLKKALIATCEDKLEAAKALDEILQLQKEMDVVATEVDIPVDEVVKRYPISEAVEIVRCKTAIFFHATCFWVISKPTFANNGKGGALFEMLESYCDYVDNRDDYDDDDKEKYDIAYAMVTNILALPLDVFTDMDLMLDISDYILRKRTEYYTRIAEEASKGHEDTLEDAIKNAEFEQEVKDSEEFRAELSEVAKKRKKK